MTSATSAESAIASDHCTKPLWMPWKADGDRVGAEAEIGGVTEAHHAAVAENEIEAHGGDGEDHDPPEEIEVEGLVQRRRRAHGHQRQRDEADADGDAAGPRVPWLSPERAGNSPCGRK